MSKQTRITCVALILSLLVLNIAPHFVPRPRAFLGALITVGAVLLTGKVTHDLVNDSVDKVEDSAKDVMREAQEQIAALIRQLETTYGNALNTTLDSLDSFTANQLHRLANLFDQINQKLMEDVAIIEQAVINLIKEATQAISQVISQLEDLIVVGVRGATFVIDKATYNMVFIIAIVLLSVGLLFFVSLLWRGTVPRGWVRVVALLFMSFYITLLSALMVPHVRVYAITMVGQASKLNEIGPGAKIFSATPSKVIKGANVDITLIGANFDAGGAPKAVIANQEIAPQAWSDSHVVLRLSGSLANLNGPQSIAVKTADGKTSSPIIVEFAPPPPPAQVTSWRIVPSGKVWEYKQYPAEQISCKSFGFFPDTKVKHIQVEAGWELAVDAAHTGTVNTQVPGSYPNPPLGFTETQYSVNIPPAVMRSIVYLPDNNAAKKTGIAIHAICHPHAEFTGKYAVWGRKSATGDGAPYTGGPCLAQGIRKCGAYPAEKLATFVNGKPETWNLMLTIRTPSGKTVDKSGVLTVNSPGMKITVEGVSVWMENNDLWVHGPGGNKPKLPDIILRPMPIGKLPIWK